MKSFTFLRYVHFVSLWIPRLHPISTLNYTVHLIRSDTTDKDTDKCKYTGITLKLLRSVYLQCKALLLYANEFAYNNIYLPKLCKLTKMYK